DHETSVYRVSKQHSLLSVPEGNRIPKTCGIRICEDQMPMRAAVDSFVQFGRGGRTTRHCDGVVGIPAPHSAEVQVSGCRRNGALLPEIAVIFAAEDDA